MLNEGRDLWILLEAAHEKKLGNIRDQLTPTPSSLKFIMNLGKVLLSQKAQIYTGGLVHKYVYKNALYG